MSETKWEGQEVDGFTVFQPPEGNTEIWDSDTCIVVLKGCASKEAVKAAILGLIARLEKLEQLREVERAAKVAQLGALYPNPAED